MIRPALLYLLITNLLVPSANAADTGTALEAYPGGPVLTVLKSGSFKMGSTTSNYGVETPMHPVKVARFAMGQTELSFAHWDACVNDTSSALRCSYKPNDLFGRSDHPVMLVSYNDIVQQYLPWLNAKTQAKAPYQFRLPTEAEWEYAARANGRGEFSLGPDSSDKIDATKANYDASFNNTYSPKGEWRKRTVVVKSFEPNAFGLYNMHGNVWEWVADCYHRDEYQRRKNAGGEWPANKTSEEKSGCDRILRGGSWAIDAMDLRSACRDHASPPSQRYNFFGFRLARSLAP